MRLIDADAIKLPKGFFETVDNVPKFYEWLDAQPTIDAVEVVRCNDCGYCESAGYSYYFCIKRKQLVYKDEYCSRRERRKS